jgi:hypothetical protein
MSILKFWKSFFLPIQLGFGGGGGGSPAPTSSTTQTSNIPEYARPYVETMLGSTQQQIYNTTTDSEGNTQITGIKPYVPYSQNPTDYVAPFSPMQQQAQQGTANLQTPEQFNQATGMAGMGGMGTYGTTQQLANTGNQYNRMATDPYSVQAFMNPYVAASLAPQQQLLNQQYGVQSAAQQGAATSAGAFGGSRSALQQGLTDQNRLMAQQQLLGQGYNQAYNNAMQNMQYGANLGLQGRQAALGGYGQMANIANTLAGIGGQQLGAQQSILSAQNQAGAQQQQQQQNIINQAIQNYATAQQYPQQQLAFMNAQIRGLPLQTMTTQGYQAAPSSVSQIAGLGTAALGAYKLGTMKEGGIVKLASGGVTGMTKDVLLQPEKYSIGQINGMVQKNMVSKLAADPILDAKMKDQQQMKMAMAGQQPAPINTIDQDIQARAQRAGIDNAPSNLPVMSAFDGGIVAMAQGGEVPHYDGTGPSQVVDDGESYFDRMKKRLSAARNSVTTVPGMPTIAGIPLFGAADKSKLTQSDSQPDELGRHKAGVDDTNQIQIGPRGNQSAGSGASLLQKTTGAPDYDFSGKGIDELISKYSDQLKGATEDHKAARSESAALRLMEAGLGMMGGTSPFAGVNIGQGATQALRGYGEDIRSIQAQRQKDIMQQATLGLKGAELKGDLTKLGIMAPYYQAHADYFRNRPASTSGLGSVPAATADKVLTRYEGYATDPKSAPFFAQLPKDVQKGLTDYKPGTKSYQNAMNEFQRYSESHMNRRLNSLRMSATKGRSDGAED